MSRARRGTAAPGLGSWRVCTQKRWNFRTLGTTAPHGTRSSKEAPTVTAAIILIILVLLLLFGGIGYSRRGRRL